MTEVLPPKPPLTQLKEKWADCQRCGLAKTRKNVVFGEGNRKADILIVGEAPGETEDRTGLPFQGEAGRVLDEFLNVLKLSRRSDLYITNVVCCRPTLDSVDDRTGEKRTDNRLPNKSERLACRPRLLETIYLVDPLVIVTIGKVPFQALLEKGSTMASVHGKMHTMYLPGRYLDLPYAVMPLYHTAYLLRTHDNRKEGPWGRTWVDWAKICNVVDYLREAYYGTPQPDRKGEDGGKKEKRR